jgi:hypothetical protein
MTAPSFVKAMSRSAEKVSICESGISQSIILLAKISLLIIDGMMKVFNSVS